MALQAFDTYISAFKALYESILVINTIGAIEADEHKQIVRSIEDVILTLRKEFGVIIADYVSIEEENLGDLQVGYSFAGNTLAAGDIVLLRHQSSYGLAGQNGLWEIQQATLPPLRPSSFSVIADCHGLVILVLNPRVGEANLFTVNVSGLNITLYPINNEAPSSLLGIATTSTDPGVVSPTARVWYLGSGPGTYTYFLDDHDDPLVATEEFVMFFWNGTFWEMTQQSVSADMALYAKKTMDADLNANSFKITNLAAPVNDNDAARKIDLTSSFMSNGKNLHNILTDVNGFLVAGVVTTGGAYDAYQTTDFIAVTGSLQYSITSCRAISFYNSAKVHLFTKSDFGSPQQYTCIPNNIAGGTVNYIRVTTYDENQISNQVEQNSASTAFERFQWLMNKFDSVPIFVQSAINEFDRMELLASDIIPYSTPANMYWVDGTNGNDSYAGTKDAPWKTLCYAETRLVANDVVYVMAGTYVENHASNHNWTFTQAIATKWIAVGTVIVKCHSSGTIIMQAGGAAYPTIKGFTFDAETSRNIAFGYCAGYFISCNFINGNGLTSATIWRNTAIHGSVSTQFTNCTFSINAPSSTSAYFLLQNPTNFDGCTFNIASNANYFITYNSLASTVAQSITNCTFNLTYSNTVILPYNACDYTITGNTFNLLSDIGYIVYPHGDWTTGKTLTFSNNTVLSDKLITGALLYDSEQTDSHTWVISNNNFLFTNFKCAGAIISMVTVGNITIDGNTIETYAETTNPRHIWVRSGGATCGTINILNNVCKSRSLSGYIIYVGTDSTSGNNNKVDGVTIKNNVVYGARYFDETIPYFATHSIFYGHNKNGLIMYNICVGCGIAIAIKGNSTQTSGGIFYNTVINSDQCIVNKGLKSVKIYNNSIYVRTANSDSAIRLAYNDDPASYPNDNIIKNNAVYYTGALMVLVETGITGTIMNYNCFYAGTVSYYLQVGASQYNTYAGFATCGFEANGKNVNPYFQYEASQKLKLRSGSGCINVGENLGSTDGINLGIDWTYRRGIDAALKTLNQNSFGNWDIGAYVYES